MSSDFLTLVFMRLSEGKCPENRVVKPFFKNPFDIITVAIQKITRCGMYVSNRKNAYKVVRQFKNGKVDIVSQYGVTLRYHRDYLIEQGYKFIKSKPALLKRGAL